MTGFATAYHGWILWIGERTQLSDDILHLHAGMAVLLVARVLTRRSLGSFVPLAFVVVAEAANELLDRLATGGFEGDLWLDVFNTLLWPAVLSLAIRLRPQT